MPTTRRCIFGCQTTGVAIHTFPQPTKDPDRFKIWVKLAGDLLKDLSDEEIYHRKRVCDIHFLPQHKTRNNRLSAIAVPSLQLPGTATENVVSPLIYTEMPSTSSAINASNSTVVQPGTATENVVSPEFFIENFNLNCDKHNIAFKKYFQNSVINILIFSWCRSVNRILSGKIVYDGDDEVKSAAQLYYNKHKHNKVKK